MREYTVDINGEITEELVTNIVNELRAIYDFDKYLVDTYVTPPKELIDTVTLSINSPGGIVSGFSRIKAEVDKLKELGVYIKTYVSHMAASCAFLIALLGNERDGSEFCELMNHISTTINYGKVTSNARMAEFYLEMEDKFTQFIVDTTKIDKEWLDANAEIDQWFCYEDAIKLGIFTTQEEVSNDLLLSDMVSQLKLSGYNVVDDIHKDEVDEKELAESSKLNPTVENEN